MARAILLVALLLAAPAPAEEPLPSFRIEMKDGVVTPRRLEVPAGVAFKIEIVNSGATPAEFESLRMRKEKVLSPGAESFVTVRRLSPGDYPFFEEFHLEMDSAHGLIVAKESEGQ
ncbi:cupredoxin domain-containing protein [Cereibacter changlensis]|uniref:Cupredoxin domain-containing protein n=1 Tax=Cereibacter changlensis TaxID=402884 RepID=A0A4U0YY26_9RHOB|nr:cupredoxin domain-containing protein [Cereibacter changlensis]TKA96698.1 cupredoxin domain-containing protein [Cereibacter changlensis]